MNVVFVPWVTPRLLHWTLLSSTALSVPALTAVCRLVCSVQEQKAALQKQRDGLMTKGESSKPKKSKKKKKKNEVCLVELACWGVTDVHLFTLIWHCRSSLLSHKLEPRLD